MLVFALPVIIRNKRIVLSFAHISHRQEEEDNIIKQKMYVYLTTLIMIALSD